MAKSLEVIPLIVLVEEGARVRWSVLSSGRSPLTTGVSSSSLLLFNEIRMRCRSSLIWALLHRGKVISSIVSRYVCSCNHDSLRKSRGEMILYGIVRYSNGTAVAPLFSAGINLKSFAAVYIFWNYDLFDLRKECEVLKRIKPRAGQVLS